MRHIIAFGHRRKMGKDTAVKILASCLRDRGVEDSEIIHASFAWKVKDITHQLFAWAGIQTPEYYEENPDEKEKYVPDLEMTVRELWISVSTGGFRNTVYRDTWCKYLISGVYDARPKNINTFLLISDLRFQNEFDEIKRYGGLCIKINRRAVKTFDDEADSALKGCQDWDYEYNDLTIPETRDELFFLTDKLLYGA